MTPAAHLADYVGQKFLKTGAPDLTALCRDLGLPTTLSAVGVRPEQFEAIAEHTMTDRGVRSNPRPIQGPADIVEILNLAA